MAVVAAAVLGLVACGGDGSDAEAPPADLTAEERTWCADHPFEQEAAAQELGIAVVGDYLRASLDAENSGIEGLEPPLLAIPSSASEPLKYTLQFDDPGDADRACRAAFASRDR